MSSIRQWRSLLMSNLPVFSAYRKENQISKTLCSFGYHQKSIIIQHSLYVSSHGLPLLSVFSWPLRFI